MRHWHTIQANADGSESACGGREKAVISVVLYGRNDSYGYNLHKRAALSLNCIAELLDAPGDEILFVDYNTPDDLPTFPEAIRDTLTPHARALLRILRVRPAHHRRFAEHSHLLALEPIARNAAVRRANPANRWVLSTNTDMIFVPRDGRTLSAICATLPDGYYHLPRFELPETLWEMLDRGDPAGTIAAVAGWGQRYHLNEIVTLPLPALRYDGPGDFQLILRADLDRIHGFDERMLLGWHVDSNIAVRLALLHGGPGEIVHAVFGYHCDHTRQATPAHRPGAASNDWGRFVSNVTAPQPPGQPGWGLADARLEDLSLADGRRGGHAPYLAALDAALPTPMTNPTEVAYGASLSDSDTDHMVPFIIDALCTAPPATVVAWIASDPALLHRVRAAWPALGFTAPIRAAIAGPDGALPAETAELAAAAEILVFDFAATPNLRAQPNPPTPDMLADPALSAVATAFRHAVIAEHYHMTTNPPRRFIAINAAANTIEPLVTSRIGATMAPFSTRLRQGFVRPATVGLNIMPAVVGEALNGGVRIRLGRRGQVATGICLELGPGAWSVTLDFTPDRTPPIPFGPLKLEALRHDIPFARRYLLANGMRRQLLRLDFILPVGGSPHDVTIRLHSIGLVAGCITAAAVTRSAMAGTDVSK